MATIIQTFIICVTLLFAALLILLSLPKSQLRFFLLEILGWTGAALAGLYILCPIDVIPDFIPIVGWIDDGFALIGGIVSCLAAIAARSDRQRSLSQPPRPDATHVLSHRDDNHGKPSC
jgi:hypothetical protein